MPHSNRVDSLSNFLPTHAEEDELIVEYVYEEAANLTEADLKRFRTTAFTIRLALALDYLFLPTLLMKVDQTTDNTLPKGPTSTLEPVESDK